MCFVWEHSFLSLQEKKRNNQIKKQKHTTKNKEGLVALRATSPDALTLPKKQKKNTKQKQNKPIKHKEGLGRSEVALRATSPDP